MSGTMSYLRHDMCSNFGFNHHPGRPPCALESRWYSFAVRFVNWLKWQYRYRTVRLPGHDGFHR